MKTMIQLSAMTGLRGAIAFGLLWAGTTGSAQTFRKSRALALETQQGATDQGGVEEYDQEIREPDEQKCAVSGHARIATCAHAGLAGMEEDAIDAPGNDGEQCEQQPGHS